MAHTISTLLVSLVSDVSNINNDILKTTTKNKKTLKDSVAVLCSASSVAPMKVTMAAILCKMYYPSWDTRMHQKQIGGKYSLRTMDRKHVSQTLHRLGLVATNTEGALTRSFERSEPYTLTYSGNVKPVDCKEAFLQLLDFVNTNFNYEVCGVVVKEFLRILLTNKLIAAELNVKTPSNNKTISLKQTVQLFAKINALKSGASMISPIIIHTLCKIVLPTIKKGTTVKELREHTSADSKTNSFGDIECVDSNGDVSIVFEVKHNLTIDVSHIDTLNNKLKECHTEDLQAYIVTSKPTLYYVTEQNIIVTEIQTLVCQWLSLACVVKKNILDEFMQTLQENILGYKNVSLKTKKAISTMFKEILD